MTSSELQFDPFDLPPTGSEASPVPGSKAALKQQVADRLAAHRSRRIRRVDSNVIAIPNLDPSIELHPESDPAPAVERVSRLKSHPEPRPALKSASGAARAPGKSRADRVAAAVAERYAQSTTYREFLAAEAERAIAQANATAEVAARNAQAVMAVQQQLLAELDLWDEPAPSPPHPSQPEPVPAAPARVLHASQPAREPNPQTEIQPFASGLTVRLYEDVGLRQTQSSTNAATGLHQDEALALNHLDDEIAFRHAPVFDEPAGPTVAIPANLIEFPRQLIAARKARPRVAEGPLRDEADAVPSAAQLRIFEVDANQFSTAPSIEPETKLPEWSTIHLDAIPVATPESRSAAESSAEAHLQTQMYVPLQVASLSHRLMASAVDACILGATFLAAVSAFAYSVKSLPNAAIAVVASAATLLVLFVLYHMLFFTLSCATPGMRYARIGLCTFSDDNPTRAEMRRRVWFVLLAACPFGLGVLWAFLDEDGLGWHDRLSRIYQRSY